MLRAWGGPGMAEKRKTGRPSSYTETIAGTICERIAAGESLRGITSEAGMPDEATVYRWIAKDESFREKYALARARAMDVMAEELLLIADDGRNDTYTDAEGNERTDADVIARSRLRVDTRKWLMSKLAPKKYGDRVDLTHSAPDGGPVRLMNVMFGAEPDAGEK